MINKLEKIRKEKKRNKFLITKNKNNNKEI
jgi:hypothetical protein